MLILKLIVNKLKKLRSLHKDEQNEGGEDDLKTLKMKIE